MKYAGFLYILIVACILLLSFAAIDRSGDNKECANKNGVVIVSRNYDVVCIRKDAVLYVK